MVSHGSGAVFIVITYVITVAHPARTAKVRNFSSLSVELLVSIKDLLPSIHGHLLDELLS